DDEAHMAGLLGLFERGPELVDGEQVDLAADVDEHQTIVELMLVQCEELSAVHARYCSLHRWRRRTTDSSSPGHRGQKLWRHLLLAAHDAGQLDRPAVGVRAERALGGARLARGEQVGAPGQDV